ncbi:sensor histidine kinase N-terminal domain-containing protein [Citreicella sp. C3M06]|uniref:sensor histidine kinase n=1 Tax=Citreicella sp. C3M06 TaxID=2841564 RepID=UPI001C085413|nr:sensor histidine kinase [Citreicella sp. C3M06]MBU2961897.1 sensor histidine kinase N-terminal domain-containing protein [Citreicella sp. C3M06]
MTSIRSRLLLILLAATGAIWLCAVLWAQHNTRAEVIRVLDRRLEESARMVASLIGEGGVGVEIAGRALSHAGPEGMRRQLSCQVWGLDGQYIGGSQGAPAQQLGDGDGFSETYVDGEQWRVFTLEEPGLGFRVMVGDAVAMRDHLVSGVVKGLAVPALLVLPLLAALIWVIVGRGMAPLDRLGRALAGRGHADLGPLDDRGAPRELRPMLDSLNGLLARVSSARERERNFTAFAAHELKTPLAGLRTQAEIARLAPDEATRAYALLQIERGVKRSDRMVRQLLEMAAVDRDTPQGPKRDAAEVLRGTVVELTPLADRRGVTLSINALPGLWQTDRPPLLHAALRNLLENAIEASPEGTTVDTELSRDGQTVRFSISDRGPGIAEALRPRVTERFFRASNSGTGSGLGLAIVAAAMERMGGTLSLSARSGGGEHAELILPA